jgi:RNA polymerase primary sigma factor
MTRKSFKIEIRHTEINSKSLPKYFSDLKVNFDTNPIPKSEERVLIKKAQAGCMESRDKLVQSNLRFAISYAKAFYKGNPTLQLCDLVQEANLGLIESVMKYNLDYNYKLFSYAHFWMHAKINTSITKNMNTIRLPCNGIKDSLSVKKAKDSFYNEHQRLPSDQEVAEMTNQSIRNVSELQKIGFTKSLNEKLSDDAGESRELIHSLGCEPKFDTLDTLREVLDPYLNKLKVNERILLKYRFGLDGVSLNGKERAESIGVGLARGRQIEAIAIQKLRDMIGTNENISQFL